MVGRQDTSRKGVQREREGASRWEEKVVLPLSKQQRPGVCVRKGFKEAGTSGHKIEGARVRIASLGSCQTFNVVFS